MEKFSIASNHLSYLFMKIHKGKLLSGVSPVLMEVASEYDDDIYGCMVSSIDINVTVSKYIEESDKTLYLKLRLSPSVFFYSSNSENMDNIMKVEVPFRMINYLQGLVWNLSSEAEVPVMLDEDDFTIIEMDGEDECDDEDENTDPADEQDGQVPSPQKYMFDTTVETFKELTSYKYYYRFFMPVEYRHPHFEECSEELWEVLYQLLFGSLDVNCHLEDLHDGSLDLLFYDDDESEKCVCNLELHELYALLMRLWTELGTELLPLMDPENLNEEVEFENDEGDLISKEDFFSFFNQEVYTMDDTAAAKLSKMYDRLVQCDSESFPYCC